MPRYRGTPEGSVRSAVQDYLTARRIWWTRMQTGAHVAQSESGKKRFIAYGLPGMADLLAFIPWSCGGVIPLWLECKAEGGKQSRVQKLFEVTVTELGHEYRVVRSIDELEADIRDLDNLLDAMDDC